MRTDRRRLGRAVLAELSRQPQVQLQVREKAAAIRDDAKAMAARRSGRLARSGIGIERDRDPATGFVRWLVGWTPAGWYGLLVEEGTADTPPRPHLVPAAIKHGAVGRR